jgi:hypothetical protein
MRLARALDELGIRSLHQSNSNGSCWQCRELAIGPETVGNDLNPRTQTARQARNHGLARATPDFNLHA